MDTLISNVTVVTMNERSQVLFGAYLGITDGKITYLDKVPPQDTPATIVDGTGMVAMPGLVNCRLPLQMIFLIVWIVNILSVFWMVYLFLSL